MGCCKLSKVIVSMAQAAKLDGKIMNHSLRVTTSSCLYQSNYDEQLAVERAGHHSISSVRSYKRTSSGQLKEMSSVLYGNGNKIM